jgi:hypothetical protein
MTTSLGSTRVASSRREYLSLSIEREERWPLLKFPSIRERVGDRFLSLSLWCWGRAQWKRLPRRYVRVGGMIEEKNRLYTKIFF